MKRILFLGGPIFQLPIIEKAREMGLRIGVVDIDERAPAREVADDFFHASILNCEAVFSIVEQYKPNGVISGACDTSVQTVAAVCQKFNLPGNSLETALKSTNKLLMLEAFLRGGGCRIQGFNTFLKQRFPRFFRFCHFLLFLSQLTIREVGVLI